MQFVCRGCLKKISVADRINAFDENAWVCLHETAESVDNTRRVKLSEGIELIIGHKIAQTKGHRFDLCNACFRQVESYINFRARILFSLRTSNNIFNSIDASTVDVVNAPDPPDTNARETAKFGETFDPKVRTDDELPKHMTRHQTTDNDLNIIVNDDTSVKLKISESSIQVENSAKVHSNATSFYHSRGIQQPYGYEQYDTSDSIGSPGTSKPRNNQENFDTRSLDDSDEDPDSSVSEIIPLKIEENDIESEIDVCSGEDDEVLELDGQSRRDEIVEIKSSSESDIEVCDYEPTGKKIRSYNALSPPLLF